MEYNPKRYELIISRVLHFFGFHRAGYYWEFRYENREQ